MNNLRLSFHKATKQDRRLTMAINGPSGSGKTYTSLLLATELASEEGQRIAVLDTENGSSEIYADLFEFDVMTLPNNGLRTYIDGINLAVSEGYEVVIVDSLSHAWNGKGGVLETVDIMNSNTPNSGWRTITPLQNEFIDTILRCPIHLIGTMQVKTKMSYEKNDRGRIEPKKIGLAPVQREGFEYNFDIIMDMTIEHAGYITKSRAYSLSGYAVMNPGVDLAHQIKYWLSDSEVEPDRESEAWKKKVRHFHALGTELFNGRWDEVRHTSIRRITNGIYQSTNNLKDSQIDRMIEGLKTKKKENARTRRAAPAPGEPHDEPAHEVDFYQASDRLSTEEIPPAAEPLKTVLDHYLSDME